MSHTIGEYTYFAEKFVEIFKIWGKKQLLVIFCKSFFSFRIHDFSSFFLTTICFSYFKLFMHWKLTIDSSGFQKLIGVYWLISQVNRLAKSHMNANWTQETREWQSVCRLHNVYLLEHCWNVVCTLVRGLLYVRCSCAVNLTPWRLPVFHSAFVWAHNRNGNIESPLNWKKTQTVKYRKIWVWFHFFFLFLSVCIHYSRLLFHFNACNFQCDHGLTILCMLAHTFSAAATVRIRISIFRCKEYTTKKYKHRTKSRHEMI